MKLHAVIDIKNFEIIDYSITDDHVSDAREGISIIKVVMDSLSLNTAKEIYITNNLYKYIKEVM